MANIYVRSSDGNNTDNGSTWALAKANLTGAAGIDAAGDTIYFASTHSETTTSQIIYTSPGTIASPVRLLSVSDAAEPPTTLAAGAVIDSSGASTFIQFEGYIYAYGLTITTANSTNYGLIFMGSQSGPHNLVFDTCTFRCNGNHTASAIQIGRDGLGLGNRVRWINSSVKFANANSGIEVAATWFEWVGGVNGGAAGGLESGGTNPTGLFTSVGDMDGNTTQRGARVLVDGVDFSNMGTTVDIITRITGGSVFIMRNCKLPASWTGDLVGTTIEVGAVAMMINCDSGDTNYKFRYQINGGLLDHETTLVRSGGATDESTPVSFKVVTTTNCGPGSIFRSPEMHVRNDAVGSAITVTVELLHDSATNLTDDEVWIEVTHNGTSGNPMSETVTDRKADALATAADQASSSVTWTTTGMTNPNKQKCSVSITPEEVGTIVVRLCIAKASKTLYYDPEPVLS